MRPAIRFLAVLPASLIAAAAHATPGWTEDSLARAAAACTADGAYGYRFGDRQPRFGFVFTKAALEDGPITEISINTSFKTFQVFVIDGVAIFIDHDGPGGDADKAAAQAFFTALDAKIQATRPFARREVDTHRSDTIRYWSSTEKDTGYSLTVSRSGVRVGISCKAEGMNPLVWHEGVE